jgi:hypothetical protein
MSDVQLLGQRVKTEGEIRDELEQIRRSREGNWMRYGRDGTVELWRKTYAYRGVKYEIACLKYFSFNEPDPLDARVLELGEWLVLEYTMDEAAVHETLESLNLYHDWLYNDTCHTEFQNVPLEEQEKYLHEQAKKDIDFLLDRAVSVLEERASELKRMIESMRGGGRE